MSLKVKYFNSDGTEQLVDLPDPTPQEPDPEPIIPRKLTAREVVGGLLFIGIPTFLVCATIAFTVWVNSGC